MNLEKPYFFTWSKQKGNSHFELFGTKQFSLETNLGELTDLTSLSYNASFGLKNSSIQKAITQQLNDFPQASTKSHFKLKEDVSTHLLKHLWPGKIFYTLSGAESVENALKISRLIKSSSQIASLQNSYHGASLGALSVGGDWRTDAAKFSVKDWTYRLPSSQGRDCHLELENFFENLKEPLAAVIIETVTGGNGCFAHDPQWLDTLSRYHKDLGFHLILDEVICGFGRTGSMFGFNQYPQLRPDIVCMSKAISGSFIPFGALWVKQEITQHFNDQVFPCGLTNYAHPLGLAATKAVLDILDEDFFHQLAKRIDKFHLSLNDISKLSNVKAVRFNGMLAAIELNKTPTIEFFWSHKLSLILLSKTIMLAPILTMPEEILEQALKKLKKSIEELI